MPRQPLLDLLEARRFDIYPETFSTRADLETYARKTSSAVIELAMRILGEPGAADLDVARTAGIAYAIAGLARSVAFHASRGKIFVPEETLARHGSAHSGQSLFGAFQPGHEKPARNVIGPRPAEIESAGRTFTLQTLLKLWQKLVEIGLGVDVQHDAPDDQCHRRQRHEKHWNGKVPVPSNKLKKRFHRVFLEFLVVVVGLEDSAHPTG